MAPDPEHARFSKALNAGDYWLAVELADYEKITLVEQTRLLILSAKEMPKTIDHDFMRWLARAISEGVFIDPHEFAWVAPELDAIGEGESDGQRLLEYVEIRTGRQRP